MLSDTFMQACQATHHIVAAHLEVGIVDALESICAQQGVVLVQGHHHLFLARQHGTHGEGDVAQHPMPGPARQVRDLRYARGVTSFRLCMMLRMKHDVWIFRLLVNFQNSRTQANANRHIS